MSSTIFEIFQCIILDILTQFCGHCLYHPFIIKLNFVFVPIQGTPKRTFSSANKSCTQIWGGESKQVQSIRYIPANELNLVSK